MMRESSTSVPLSPRLLASTALAAAMAVACPARADFAYVSQTTNNSVAVVDTGTNAIVATVAVGGGPGAVAVSTNGNWVYVANECGAGQCAAYDLEQAEEGFVPANGTVSVIKANTRTVEATVTVGKGPRAIAVNPAGSRVYVANAVDRTLSVIDTSTNTVTSTVSLPGADLEGGVAVTNDGTKIFVGSGTNLLVLNATTFAVSATIAIGTNPRGIAVKPDDSRVYVTNCGAVPSCSLAKSRVSIVNVATNAVVGHVSIGKGYPGGLAVNQAGTRLYAATATGAVGTGSLTVIDVSLATPAALKTINVGVDAVGVGVLSDGSKAYVVGLGSDSLAIIATSTNTVQAHVPMGTGFSRPASLGKFIGVAPSGC